MDKNRRRFVERHLKVLRTKSVHAELMQTKTYRAVYERAISLIDQGHDPSMVALAFSSATSVLLEMIYECANKRTPDSQTSDSGDGPSR